LNAASIVFYILAAVAVGSAAMVIASRSAIHSAIYLVLSFLSMAGLYVLLEAEFVAAVQVLVYAGGIMVLFLFVILLVNLRDPSGARLGAHAAFSGGAGLAVAALIFYVYQGGAMASPIGSARLRVGGNLQAIGETMFRDYLLPFEIASVFLLVAMVAVIVLTRANPRS